MSSNKDDNMRNNILIIFNSKESIFSQGRFIESNAIFCMLANIKACIFSMFLVSL